MPPLPGPTGMTYSSLVDDIKRYVERGSEDDEAVIVQIPRIINNTERDLATRLKIQGYQGTYTSTMQAENPVLEKPEGWRSTISLNYGQGVDNNRRKALRLRELGYLQSLYPNELDLGAPEFYADYDLDHWYLVPTPARSYPFQALVYRLPPLLSPSNQTNYLTIHVPNLILFGCLANMEAFLRNDSRVAGWSMQAKEALDAVNAEDLRRMVDRGQLRSTD